MKKGQNPKGEEMLGVTLGSNQYLNRLEEEISKVNYGTEGDLVIAITGSGNSPNVIRAVDWANRHGLTTFGLTGYRGGNLRKIQRHGLWVDLDDMGMVESIHLCLFHWVLNDVYARINSQGRHAQEE